MVVARRFDFGFSAPPPLDPQSPDYVERLTGNAPYDDIAVRDILGQGGPGADYRAKPRVTFTDPLDEETAADPDSWSALQWNYKWSSEYGSRHWSVKEPDKQGHDTLGVKSAKLSEDGRSVFLEIPDLRPVMRLAKVRWQPS